MPSNKANKLNQRIQEVNENFGYEAVSKYSGKGYGRTEIRVVDNKGFHLGQYHAKNTPAVFTFLAGIEAAQFVAKKGNVCQKAQKNSWAMSLKKLFS